jgi:hypothetical protein
MISSPVGSVSVLLFVFTPLVSSASVEMFVLGFPFFLFSLYYHSLFSVILFLAFRDSVRLGTASRACAVVLSPRGSLRTRPHAHTDLRCSIVK